MTTDYKTATSRVFPKDYITKYIITLTIIIPQTYFKPCIQLTKGSQTTWECSRQTTKNKTEGN